MINASNENDKKECSNDALDAVAAIVIIAVVVFGVVYWLNGMPS